jgi:hypothetical protein
VRTRTHPIRQELDYAAGGGEVSDERIAELVVDAPDPDKAFTQFRDAADTCGELKAAGRMKEARDHARQWSEYLAKLCGPLTPRPDPVSRDPKVLADQIGRVGLH